MPSRSCSALRLALRLRVGLVALACASLESPALLPRRRRPLPVDVRRSAAALAMTAATSSLMRGSALPRLVLDFLIAALSSVGTGLPLSVYFLRSRRRRACSSLLARACFSRSAASRMSSPKSESSDEPARPRRGLPSSEEEEEGSSDSSLLDDETSLRMALEVDARGLALVLVPLLVRVEVLLVVLVLVVVVVEERKAMTSAGGGCAWDEGLAGGRTALGAHKGPLDVPLSSSRAAERSWRRGEPALLLEPTTRVDIKARLRKIADALDEAALQLCTSTKASDVAVRCLKQDRQGLLLPSSERSSGGAQTTTKERPGYIAVREQSGLERVSRGK